MAKKKYNMTSAQQDVAEELYKAHFTAKEAEEFLPFKYGCLSIHWKKFRYAKIKQYNRFSLIENDDIRINLICGLTR